MVYEEITDLEDVSKKAVDKIGASEYLMNFDLKVSFKKSLVINSRISDVYNDAQDFQNFRCPNTLYMNHGEYIHKAGDGIENVITQLKDKQASNRAIISLINQENILRSKDNPIPSFMILQFSIENNNELYVTTYFKALEVSKFLRINTEEIRQIIEKIMEKILNIRTVNLNIIAFRAYINSNINPMKKPRIDLLKERNFLKYLKSGANLEDLINLLEEKKTSSTVIDYSSFDSIIGWLEDEDSSELINPSLKRTLVIQIFKEIVQILKNLKDLREKTSHNKEIDMKQIDYENKIGQLISEIRNDS